MFEKGRVRRCPFLLRGEGLRKVTTYREDLCPGTELAEGHLGRGRGASEPRAPVCLGTGGGSGPRRLDVPTDKGQWEWW